MSIDQARTHDGRFGTMPSAESGTTLTVDAPETFGGLPLAPGVTRQDADLYTSSNCQQLAFAMHEATGWPYAAVVDGRDEKTGAYGWIHVGVMRPDGNFLDVEGAQDVDSVLDQYGDLSEHEDGESWLVIVSNLKELHLDLARDFPPEDQDRARAVAAAVLAADEPARTFLGQP
jgi:hypothetical protein